MSLLKPRSGHSHCLHRPRGLSGFRDLLVLVLVCATLCPAHPPPCHCPAGSASPPASVLLPLPPRSLPWLRHCFLRCPGPLSICHPGMSMAFEHRPEARSVLPNLTRRKFTAWSCRPSGGCTQPAPPPCVLWRVRFEESASSALRFPGNLDGPTQASLEHCRGTQQFAACLHIALAQSKDKVCVCLQGSRRHRSMRQGLAPRGVTQTGLGLTQKESKVKTFRARFSSGKETSSF